MIQLARESRGYTQTELADILGIQQSNLSRMERGDIGVKEDILNNLCEKLNYPKDFFYLKTICHAGLSRVLCPHNIPSGLPHPCHNSAEILASLKVK